MPENAAEMYSFFRNGRKEVTHIYYSPVSQSGDSFTNYMYAFDEKGRTKVFKRESNFVNAVCTDNILREYSTYLFGEQFAVIGKTYSLLDDEGYNWQTDNCIFNYRFPYTIEPNKAAFIHLLNKVEQ